MIELADVIKQLRQELDRARISANGEDLRFELGPIELEVAVELEAVGGGAGKIRFWVVELGADAHATSTSTQRIKLTLNPTVGRILDANGNAASAYVSGTGVTGER